MISISLSIRPTRISDNIDILIVQMFNQNYMQAVNSAPYRKNYRQVRLQASRGVLDALTNRTFELKTHELIHFRGKF